MTRPWHKLDMQAVANSTLKSPEEIKRLQVSIFVMCGGGRLGRFAAEQPADFYIDDRVGGLPYCKTSIKQAVAVLATLAEAAGFDPHHLADMGDFHGCGIW